VLLLDDRSATDLWQVNGIAHGVLNMEVQQMDYGVERRRLAVLKLRATKFRGGYHDYVIKTGGLAVFPRLVAAEHLPSFISGSAPTGIEGLDLLMGGGLDRGSANLFLGPAGSGKSSLAMRCAVEAGRRGELAWISTD
jgi:circadian clock protein KaiC